MIKKILPLILILSSCGGVPSLNDLQNASVSTSTSSYAGAGEPAARIIFHKDNFTDLSDFVTSKHTQFQCLGDVTKVYYSNGADYTGSPSVFPTSSTPDDFSFTNKPEFLKNVSVDMTNTYYPLSQNNVVQTDACSFRGIGGSSVASPCADFDAVLPNAPGPYNSTSGSGVVTTFAGSPGLSGTTDSTGTLSRFNAPTGVAVDSSGNVYVADSLNHTVRKITSAGVTTTIAGIAGVQGTADGALGVSTFNTPAGVAVDSAGNVYVADSLNSTIRMITTANVVSTYAGIAGAAGTTDGAAVFSQFDHPTSIAIDSDDNLYVADSSNSTIRKISTAGIVSTVAGVALTTGSADGALGVGLLNNPTGVAVDWNGDLYVADYGNSTIRKITSAGVMSTIAGSAGVTGTADGLTTTARFNLPTGVAVDYGGNVFVADKSNSAIREIISGVTTTLAGSVGTPGTTDSTGISAKFNNPYAVAVGVGGVAYVADSTSSTIRKINFDSTPGTIAYYASQYYRVRDDWCANQGPISDPSVETTKAYVGGVNIDIDRTLLGAAEDMLLTVTYQALNANSAWPGTQTTNDETILRVNLVGTALGLANLLSSKQPHSTREFSNTSMPVYLKEIATLRDPFSSLRTEQVYVPLSLNSLVDRIRLERVRGSFQLYQVDLYRLGNRAN